MYNDIPNTYTLKKGGETFRKGPSNLGQVTGKLPIFVQSFSALHYNCIYSFFIPNSTEDSVSLM